MRILFVEDDEDLRHIIGDRLNNEFQGVIEIASSGNEGIRLLEAGRPYDIIISDYSMPDGSGVDLLRFKLKNGLRTPFIFFTHTINPEIPLHPAEYLVIDKTKFDLLCDEVRKLVK